MDKKSLTMSDIGIKIGSERVNFFNNLMSDTVKSMLQHKEEFKKTYELTKNNINTPIRKSNGII